MAKDVGLEELESLVTSSDGAHWAGATKVDKVPALVVDGELLSTEGAPRQLCFLDDGRLVHSEKAFGGTRVVVDGVAGPAFGRVVGLTTAGSHLGYFGKDKKKGMTLWIDGQDIGHWKEAGDLVMDAAGNHAYWASTEGKTGLDPKLKGMEVVFRNGQVMGAGGSVSAPALGSDGSLAYMEAGSSWKIWKNGETVGQHEWALGPKFSSDGGRLAWPARTTARWGLCVDGEVQGDHDDVTAFAVSASGFAYAAAEDGDWFVVTDSARFGPFTRVSSIDAAPDGTFAFVARTADGLVVGVGGKVLGPFERVGRVGPVGEALGFRAGPKGGEQLYRGTRASEDAFEVLSDPVWADGAVVAFGLVKGEVRRVTLS